MKNDKEIIEKNKLIAEFMGLQYTDNPANKLAPFYRQTIAGEFESKTFCNPKYHTSWDWLLPVWRKCIDVIGLFMHTHSDATMSKLWIEKSHEISACISNVDIISAFIRISQLITYYKSLPQSK